MYSPLHPSRWRKILIGFLLFLTTILGLAVIIVPSPDLSVELEIRKQIAFISDRMAHAENLNVERKSDLQRIFSQFSDITKLLQTESHRRDEEEIMDEMSSIKGGGRSEIEGEAILKHLNWTFDLSLPSIHHYLPHTVHSPNSFVPAYKLSKNRSQVSVVLGIPTVKRDHQSYLESTLQSVFDNMSEEEMSNCLVIVFIAESDLEYVARIAAQIQSHFGPQIDRGILEVMSPPADFYPNMTKLRPTLGDDAERVQWRSKQNLDYAFLMMYAQWRGIYYVQLEDDILTKPSFLTTMLDFAAEKSALSESTNGQRPDWFVIDFCQLGFIGKMFKSSSLPVLIQFFLMFYNDKPVDWLLDHVVTTKVCKLDQDAKKCQKERAALWIHYKPSLFQHIGTHSSLRGKVQKLKDKQFGKVSLFTPHKNPTAKCETNIKHYKHHSISRAYRGETFYWGLVPQSGDFILFQLTPPVPLSLIKFVSGNVEHPSDRFVGTTVELLFQDLEDPSLKGFEKLADNFVVVGTFDANGLAEVKLSTDQKVSMVRLSVHQSSENWAILSEIYLKVPQNAAT